MKNEEEIQGPQNQQDCPTAEAMGLTQETMGVTLAKMNRAIETLDMNQPGVDPGAFQRDFYENLSSMLTIWGGGDDERTAACAERLCPKSTFFYNDPQR
jgi:hypothetical protein